MTKCTMEIGHGRSGGQASTSIEFALVENEIIVTATWKDDQGRISIIKDRIWRKSEKEKLLEMLTMMVER